MKKWLLFAVIALSFSASSFASRSWNGRIFQVSSQKDISINELVAGLAEATTIVLGEKHNTPAIQLAQASVIDSVVKATHKEGHFITAWEFLNYTDQEDINAAYMRFLSGTIDALGFLIETQGTTSNDSYIPILETTKSLQGNIIGVNISREAKKPVLKGGIGALDIKYLPPNFAMGSVGYRQRFIEVMNDHVPPDLLENYYAAQCLTDDIMAYRLQGYSDASLTFLITGSFHTDYYDGVIGRINIRLPNKSIAVVRLIDASDYDESELNETFSKILHDDTYGDIADYVYFVNEPTQAKRQSYSKATIGLI